MSNNGTINCPNCKRDFELNSAMEASIRARYQSEFEAERAKREQQFLLEKKKLEERERLLAERAQSVEATIRKEVEAQRAKLCEEEQKRATESVKLVLEQMKAQLAESKSKLEQSQKAELDLRMKQEQVEAQKKEMELLLVRAKDEAREAATRAKDEEFRLREAEYKLKMEQMLKQLEEAKKRAEQGSQQAQGEVMELDIENTLRTNFLRDDIIEVAKGVFGGDLHQRVRNDAGQECGTIFWEFKRTKNWDNKWLDKARADCLAAKAQAAVVVTQAAPDKLFAGLARLKDVWVVSPGLVVPLAMSIRQSLIGLCQVRRSYEGKQDKMSMLYDYIAGPEFQDKMKHILDTFVIMKSDLDTERRAMERIWKQREKQIEKIILNTTSLHGELGGIVGRDLPGIDALDLKALADGREK
jgi:hypothetical protein